MSRLAFFLLAGAWIAAGCGSPSSEPPPPPAETLFVDAAAVAQQRAAKDREFKTMDDSPIVASERPTFEGLEYYPYDPSLRFAVRFRPFDDPEPLLEEGDPELALQLLHLLVHGRLGDGIGEGARGSRVRRWCG